ncbi:HindIII family type II restriction endonuclease [Corynebacterium diphtheriae]|uniref:HindIII family type II restriction endonuclease n=1 Tax=Corynebacterium diphtheriae TaxID=1717 RepID=A0A811GA37_CORDP|nr:HindIII family type II restriction endonuclease [Corynebacterium diphtheriae]OJI01487.1 hypothetical protein BJU21_03125 [Corynebacterium diphtheriae]OSQ08545.1 hypothetical protein B1A59_03945 [Corynebacterium diphtheriae]OWM96835.1 hypothetical protein AY481_04060 [Corynebacterium diphtheriae bv. mitis]CAB0542230.1 HindIII family type II restriction endonuclease [Corynebacterium diphtheriae]CAB0594879.1 HindIII family type II restriction endonuclease [Corynebacterium diphtheriae]
MEDIYNLENFVDKAFSALEPDVAIDTDNAIGDFKAYVEKYDNAELVSILTVSGYIPDLYAADSSEETLYTKLCEVLEVVWAERMGFEAYAITQKASYEDVVIKIGGCPIVSDTKTFRLSRSQGAPNVKDFVKPEDYSKWIKRHEGTSLGGLVIYPQLHEWKKSSDAYRYCSNSSNPIVMLPFHYLAFFLRAKDDDSLAFNVNDLSKLWDFERIFPEIVSTRSDYWQAMNSAIIDIVGCDRAYLTGFLKEAENLMLNYVLEQRKFLTETIDLRAERVKEEVAKLTDHQVREEYAAYKTEQQTQVLQTYIDRIDNFRLDGMTTIYRTYIVDPADDDKTP